MRLLPHEGTVDNMCNMEKGRRGLQQEASPARKFGGVEDPFRTGGEVEEEGQT